MNRKVIYQTEIVYESKHIESRCNSILIVNRGDDTCRVIDEPLLQDQAVINNGEIGEMDTTRYYIEFDEVALTTQQVVIRRKFYVE